MKSEALKFLKYFIFFTLITGGIQYLVTEYTLKEQDFYYNTVMIYGFLFLITLFLYISVLYINKFLPDYTGYAFMASGVLKMVFSILFLLPIIIKDDRSYVADVISFFIPYFLYLFFETVFVVKLLQNQK